MYITCILPTDKHMFYPIPFAFD